MPLYVGDYLADTRHLTTVEHGAYILLIMHYWRTGGLPNEDMRLAQIAGLTHDEWSSSRGVISAFFDANWKHKRVEFELTEAARISAAGRAGGLASGKARQNRTTVQRPFNDTGTKREALQSQSHTEPRGSDARAWLFSDGLTIMKALGVAEARARPMLGRWLQQCGDNHEHLKQSILRAEKMAPADAIPWITQSLKGSNNAKTGNVIAAADRLVERLAEFRQPAPREILGGPSQVVIRAIPERRGE